MSIDILKASVARHRGYAKANRFSVNIFPAVTTGIRGITNELNLYADSVSIPGKQIGSYDYALNSLMNIVKHPQGYTLEDVEITFNLTNTYFIKRLFDNWQKAIIDDKYMLHYPDNYEATILINQLDEKNRFVYGVKLLQAYPITINNIGLSNESTNTISKLSVTFTYTSIENI